MQGERPEVAAFFIICVYIYLDENKNSLYYLLGVYRGKVTPVKEGITISSSLVCLAIIHIIWHKYIRKDEVLKTKLAKNPGGLVVLWLSMAGGIAVCSLLMSLPD